MLSLLMISSAYCIFLLFLSTFSAYSLRLPPTSDKQKPTQQRRSAFIETHIYINDAVSRRRRSLMSFLYRKRKIRKWINPLECATKYALTDYAIVPSMFWSKSKWKSRRKYILDRATLHLCTSVVAFTLSYCLFLKRLWKIVSFNSLNLLW